MTERFCDNFTFAELILFDRPLAGGYTGIPTPTFAQCKEANAMKLGEAVQTGDGGVTYAIQPPAKGLQLFGGQWRALIGCSMWPTPQASGTL